VSNASVFSMQTCTLYNKWNDIAYVGYDLESLLRGELFQWRHLSNSVKPTFSFEDFFGIINYT